MSDMKISVSIDVKEFMRQLGLTKDEIAKLDKKEIEIKTDKAQNSIANLRRAFAEWTLALSGVAKVVKGVISGMSKMANAAMYQQKSVSDLGAALKNTGVYSEGLQDALLKQADTIQDLTTVSSDNVVMMTRQMQAIGKMSAETLPDAQKAAVGLAKRYQVDLKTAFELVGKAAAGNTSVLGRYGIVLDASLSQAEKFNEVLRIGAEGFAFAEAETQTAAGALEQLKNAWGDLIEDIGESLILPMLTDVSKMLLSITQGANNLFNLITGQATNYQRMTKRVSEQRMEFETLIATYERLHKSTERTDKQNQQYQQTIDTLISQYGNYFDRQTLESSNWDRIAESISGARKELKNYLSARLQQAILEDHESDLVKLEKKILKAEKSLDEWRAEMADKGKQITDIARTQLGGTHPMAVTYEFYIKQQEDAIEKYTAKQDSLLVSMEAQQKRIQARWADVLAPSEEPGTGGASSGSAAPLLEAEISASAEAYQQLLDGLSKYHSERALRSLNAHQRELAALAEQLDDEQYIVLAALSDEQISEEEAQASLLALREKFNDRARGVRIKADAELLALAESRTEKMLRDEEAYYEAVQFADEEYFEWKKKKIEEEVEALTISDVQKMELIKKLLAELDQLKAEHDYTEPEKKGNWFFSGLLGFDPDSEEDMEKVATIKGIYSDMMAQASQTISGFVRLSAQRRDKEIADLEKRAAVESWTNERLLAEKAETLEHYEAEERKFKALQKAMSIAQATINIAEGVTKALSLGPIVGPALAATISALGAVQIGVINAQKFAEGGLFRGAGGPRDDANLAYISDGEYIVNAGATRRFKPILDAINYGSVAPSVSRSFYEFGRQPVSPQLMDKLSAILNKVDVINTNLVKKAFTVELVSHSSSPVYIRQIDRTRASMERSGYVPGGA